VDMRVPRAPAVLPRAWPVLLPVWVLPGRDLALDLLPFVWESLLHFRRFPTTTGCRSNTGDE
jgi:hypothetical protein